MTIDDATIRYKHTGSWVPDFLCTEHLDHEAKVLTITACDFDSAAFADMIVRHPDVIAFEDETGPHPPPTWSVVAVIGGTKFSARVVRQRLYGKPGGVGVTVRLTPI
jgi:hypothetical protein